MQIAEIILLTLHILCSSIWVTSSLILVFIFHPIWAKYHTYSLFVNFRLEFIQRSLKVLNIILALAVISGVGLIGIYQRSVLAGTYGLLFTGKMLLLISSFFLLQPYLRVYDDATSLATFEKTKTLFNARSLFLLLTNVLLLFISVYQKSTAF